MPKSNLPKLLAAQAATIIEQWINTALGYVGSGRIARVELETQCRDVFAALRQAFDTDTADDPHSPAYARLRETLGDITRSRALQGFSPSETASFVFSLKEPLFAALRASVTDADALGRDTWLLSNALDQLGLHVVEVFQKNREAVILRQQRELTELSTPVVKLWHGILALPLIGTLDSARAQVVMENLLQSIVDTEAEIAIIDITGVPTVDTLVAQHLLKTVAAARLMGADCIISGIRAQIAQTMVHLGVELNVVSKANLADAFALALARIGRTVTLVRRREGPVTPMNAG